MGRIQLFEFEDLSWFPRFLRNYENDFLRFLSEKTNLFKPAIPLLLGALRKTPGSQLIDLGSGSGGPLVHLNLDLQEKYPGLQILLTDYFPNLPAFERARLHSNNIRYYQKPVDARDVPADLKGLRTMFLVFHHFRKKVAIQILQNAVDNRQPIAIFEAQERSIPSLIAMLLSPLTVLLVTPFILPFRPGRLVFTYLLPILPLVILWDGVVSALRTYSIEEMRVLVSALSNKDSFEWKIGSKKSGPGKVLYLIGIPLVSS